VKTPDRDRPAICFQPAVERGFPIYPVAIAYSSDEAAYVGETSFVESLVAVVRALRLEVHLAMLPQSPFRAHSC